MTYTNRPDWFFGLAMNADPNDPAAVPTWSDYTTSVMGASALGRGRQYELAQTLPIPPEVTIRDVSELLNPENTSSAFYGNILPYRGVVWLGMWPNIGSTTASAGNLLNASTWRVPYDCSFESYTVGATVPWITAVGATVPVVGTTTPHAGTKDLTYTVAGTTTVQGVSWQLPCIPGRQYTVSAYVQQSSASTQGIYVDASVGSTTTTTGAYVRLTKTFTATHPYHTAYVQTSGTAVAGTVLVDDVQHEQGTSATTATTSGSVVYPVMSNFLERYSRTWGSNGFEGFVTPPCVDATAALSSIRIATEYVMAVVASVPDFYYRLSGNAPLASGIAYPDTSGNNYSPLTQLISKYGAVDLVQPGASMAIVGDPGGVGAKFTPSTFGSGKGAIIANGFINPSAGTFLWPPTASTWSASIAAWIEIGNVGGVDQQIIASTVLTAAGDVPLAHISITVTTANKAEINVSGLTGSNFADGTTTVTDSKPHLIVGTVTQVSGGNTVGKIYVDGVLENTITVTTASLGGALTRPSNALMVGGFFAYTAYEQIINGTVAHVAGWSRALSAGEVTTLWNAGGLGYAGETTGTRVARHMVLGGYNGMTRISAGSTTLGPATYSPDIDLTTDTQNSAEAEAGVTWIAPDGALVFEGRQDRWLRLTPSWILGENVAGGEIPYLGDIEYDYDPQFLYANVQVTRNNGATAVGGSVADIATATKRFFGRTFQQSSDFATDQQAQDCANAIFYTHNRPSTRIAAVTVDAAANPTVGWPFVLGVEIGQRIRVVRRPKAANAGAGITVSLDFFVENVTHDQIDLEAGTWSTTLLCSPVGSVSSQTGVTFQPWILDDTTYSVLDSTSALGW